MRREFTDYDNQIVDTMVAQLGGREFMLMTGSKPHYKDATDRAVTICFKLKRQCNQSKANFLLLSYDRGKDTYVMEFRYFRIKKDLSEVRETVEKFEDVYCDQLQELFTEVTGMYTRL